MIGQGGEIKVTTLTESFGLEDYKALYGKGPVLLLGIDPKKQLHAFTAESDHNLAAGWTLVALVPKAALDKLAKSNGENEKGEAAAGEVVT